MKKIIRNTTLLVLVVLAGYWLVTYQSTNNTSELISSDNDQEKIHELVREQLSNQSLIEMENRTISDSAQAVLEERLLQFRAEQTAQPDDADAFMSEGVVLHSLGRFAESYQVMLAVHERFPDNYTVLTNLATIDTSQQQYQRAGDWLLDAIEVDSTIPRAYLDLATLLVRYGVDATTARQVYDYALERVSGDAIDIKTSYARFLKVTAKEYEASRTMWIGLLELDLDQAKREAIQVEIDALDQKIQSQTE